MKVVIDARESGTSTGRYVDKLVENLNSLKPKIEVMVLAKSHRLEFLKNTAPDFEIKRCDISEFSFAEQYKFVWKLYGIKNDLVHFGMTQQPILYFGRTVTTIHDLTTARFRNPAKNRLVFGFKQVVYRWVIKRVAKKSARVIVPSEYVKQDLIGFSGIDASKVTVIYEAADKITAKAEAVKNLEGAEFIMYVGRPLPHKNLERLIEAFKIIRAERPKLKLVLAGKKDILYSRLENKLKKQGTSGIVFTDFVSEGQLRWLYENTAAYVFPSLSEGFGLPPLEAMMHGAPVVSSNASCLPEVNGDAALYFDPLNIDDMASKIAVVLEDRELAKKLAQAGPSQAKKYSWGQTARQTLEVYKEALNEN